MAVSADVDAVLQFLRKNGLSDAESALKEDMIEKGDLGCLDYEKFLFPMVPPPPPVRIPASFRRSEVPGGGECSRSSSQEDDEFVSMGSSTSNMCSSSGSSKLLTWIKIQLLVDSYEHILIISVCCFFQYVKLKSAKKAKRKLPHCCMELQLTFFCFLCFLTFSFP